LIPQAEEDPAADDDDEDGRRPGGLGDTVQLEGPPDGPSKRAPHLRRRLRALEDGGDHAIRRLIGTKFEPGLGESSSPIHDARGNVIAAVDVWRPAFRLTPRRIPEPAQPREAAAAISVRLGGTAPAPQPAPMTATA
jgi:hypothetical protein